MSKNSTPTATATPFVVAAKPSTSTKAPRLGKASITSIESTMRTTCEVTRIEDGKVYVKPIAHSLSSVAEIEVVVMPLYFEAQINIGCKGIHQPLPTDKSVHAWQPSRGDSNLVRLDKSGNPVVKTEKAA